MPGDREARDRVHVPAQRQDRVDPPAIALSAERQQHERHLVDRAAGRPGRNRAAGPGRRGPAWRERVQFAGSDSAVSSVSGGDVERRAPPFEVDHHGRQRAARLLQQVPMPGMPAPALSIRACSSAARLAAWIGRRYHRGAADQDRADRRDEEGHDQSSWSGCHSAAPETGARGSVSGPAMTSPSSSTQSARATSSRSGAASEDRSAAATAICTGCRAAPAQREQDTSAAKSAPLSHRPSVVAALVTGSATRSTSDGPGARPMPAPAARRHGPRADKRPRRRSGRPIGMTPKSRAENRRRDRGPGDRRDEVGPGERPGKPNPRKASVTVAGIHHVPAPAAEDQLAQDDAETDAQRQAERRRDPRAPAWRWPAP
jgi:hypothetical protein